MLRQSDRIGPYILQHELGRGAFKEVWLAEQKDADGIKQVALSLPLETYPDMELLRQEFEAWRKASGHPNVLPLIEMAEYDGQLVFVSEFASGGTLQDWLKLHDGAAPTAEAARTMMEGILAGLEHLHAIPLLHRDLKPANVLLQDERPRLTDFGIARLFETTFQTEMPAGTYAYMSPESLNGCYSRQADLWAAGVILYLMIQGRPPFPHKAIAPLIRAIQQEEPDPLPDSVPAPLAEIVSRALSKDPARRFPDAAAMRSAISSPQSAPERSDQEASFPLEEKTYLPAGHTPREALAAKAERAEMQEESLSEESIIDRSLKMPVVEPPSVLPPLPSPPVAPQAAPEPATVSPSTPRRRASAPSPAPVGPPMQGPVQQPGLLQRFLTRLRRVWRSLSQRPAIEQKQRDESDSPLPPVSGSTAPPAEGGGAQTLSDERTVLQSSLREELPTLGGEALPDVLPIAPAPSAPIQAAGGGAPGSIPLETERRNQKDGAEMLRIPAGEFLMGSQEQDDEQPPCRIFLGGYAIYRNPVTVAQYRRFCRETGRKMVPEPLFHWQEDQPIVNVTWLDAIAYCRWAGGRLPTEAQWEKAARGTDGRKYPWGDVWDCTRCANAESEEDRRSASEVGRYPQGASPYGVLDMAGNVWEWCADWYDESGYQNSPDQNPIGPDVGFYRVLRGGSWLYSCPEDFRVSRRHKSDPQTGNLDYGFRCVLS